MTRVLRTGLAMAVAVGLALSAAPLTPLSVATAAPGQSAAVGNRAATGTGGEPLVFATWNICKIECKYGRFSWPNRRNSVARNIAAAAPDVMAVQEADIGSDHWLDVQRLLRPTGLEIANTDVTQCSGACGAHIFYKAASVQSVDLGRRASAGMTSQGSLTRGAPWRGIKQDRTMSWALLQTRSTGARFLVVSLHLPNEETRAGVAVRRAVGRALPKWTSRKLADLGMPATLPTFIMGDLNASDPEEPAGPQRILINAGFEDTYDTAKTVVNREYATYNRTHRTFRYDGWPPSAEPFRRGEGYRIDYVMARNAGTPSRWEIFLKLGPGQRFDNRYRASDHNLVRAVVPVPKR